MKFCERQKFPDLIQDYSKRWSIYFLPKQSLPQKLLLKFFNCMGRCVFQKLVKKNNSCQGSKVNLLSLYIGSNPNFHLDTNYHAKRLWIFELRHLFLPFHTDKVFQDRLQLFFRTWIGWRGFGVYSNHFLIRYQNSNTYPALFFWFVLKFEMQILQEEPLP